LRLYFCAALLPEGWAKDVTVVIKAGRIAKLEIGQDRARADEAHWVALPGMPNVHSHAFQRAMAGRTERRSAGADNFWTWREAMYRLVERIDPQSLHAVAALAFMEMLESGFTRVGEFHYLHHARDGTPYDNPAEMAGAIVEAAQETGIGLTLLPVLYQHGGFGGAAVSQAQHRFVCTLDGYARLLEACAAPLSSLGDAVLGVAPHSLRAVAPEALHAAAAWNRGPVHIHIAEQVQEVRACRDWSGMAPVEWLFAHEQVDQRWCLVHATHMTKAEIGLLAASGAVAGLCPSTEANLGDGLFPARSFVRAGGTFAVGSDSNVRIDAVEELRLLEYGQRVRWRERNVLATQSNSIGASLIASAVAGGARALGASAGIAPGASADFLSLVSDAPALMELEHEVLADAFVFAGGRELVDCVWRAGVKVVEGGRHRARSAISARYAREMRRMFT